MRRLSLGRFARDESGTMSMEAALWFPFFFAVFIFVADAAVVERAMTGTNRNGPKFFGFREGIRR